VAVPVLNKIIKSNYLPSLDPSPAHRLSGAHLHLSPLSAHGLVTMSGWGKHRSPRFHEARSSIQLWQRPSCGRAYGCGSRNGNPSSLSSTLNATTLSSPQPAASAPPPAPPGPLPPPPQSTQAATPCLLRASTRGDRHNARQGWRERENNILFSFLPSSSATAGICYCLLS